VWGHDDLVARFAANPWGPWSDEVQVFNPCRQRAYGRFMHWSGMDDINTRIPPSAAAWGDSLGFAYGAYMFDRFTTFDLATRDLSLAYLMSTSSPYQVQVMRTVEPTIESRRSRGDELKPPDPLRNRD